jgi:hypothetical protein
MKIAGQHTPFWGGQHGRFLHLYDYQDEVEAYLNGDFYKEQFLGIPKRSLEEVENYVEENYYNNDDIIREFKQHRQ